MRGICVVIVSIIVGFSSLSILADSHAENITLSRISNILNAIYPLINQANNEADQNARVMFQYTRLKKDIQDIQAGIAQKINHGVIEPRVVTPLNTNYVSQENRNFLLRNSETVKRDKP